MAGGVDFEKTPEQVRRELESGLEEMARHLAASQGHSKRGSSSLLHAVWAAALVFAGHTAYAFLLEGNGAEQDTHPRTHALSERDIRVIQNHLERLSASAASIAEVRSRIAPSMPIDAQLSSIQSSATDLRVLLVTSTPSPTDGAKRH